MTTTLTKPEYKTPADLAETQPAEMQAAAAPVDLAVAPGALVGTWINSDPATRGLVKVIIAATGLDITVNAFGACSPTPCNWGIVPGTAYAANVSSTTGIAFSAQYKFGFKTSVVTGTLQGKLLIVETFDTFTDGSGRSNYYSRYTMHK